MEVIEKRCLELFGRDYKFTIIHNANGDVCGHYPRQIVFLEYQCTDVDKDRYKPKVQSSSLSISPSFVFVAAVTLDPSRPTSAAVSHDLVYLSLLSLKWCNS